MRGDLSGIAARGDTESDAREKARILCEKTGKQFLVARVIACVQVDRFPIKWVDLGDETEIKID